MTEYKCDKSTHFGLNIKYLKSVGIWPPGDGTQLWKCILLCMFFFAGLTLQALTLCFVVLDIIINIDDMEVTDSIFSAVMTFQGLFKQVYASYHIRQFQHLVECIDFVSYKATQPFKSQKETIIKTSYLYTKTMTVCVTSTCLAASTLYPFIPLSASFHSNLSKTNTSSPSCLPYSIWFPMDKNETPYYEILYAMMSLNVTFVALYISSTDTFITSLIIHTFKQFDILQFLLRNIKEDATKHVRAANMNINNPTLLVDQSDKQYKKCEDIAVCKEDTRVMRYNTNTNLPEEDFTQELQHSLRECVKQHQQLLMYVFISELERVSEALNTAISPFFLEQLAIGVFILCTMGLHITVVPVLSFKFASALVILISALSILALFNWCGGELSLKSQAVGYAAYESDWFDTPASIKQSLNLVMARAKRPCRITAGKFMDLNLESYFLVLKTSLSYFTVLHRLYNG